MAYFQVNLGLLLFVKSFGCILCPVVVLHHRQQMTTVLTLKVALQPTSVMLLPTSFPDEDYKRLLVSAISEPVYFLKLQKVSGLGAMLRVVVLSSAMVQ